MTKKVYPRTFKFILLVMIASGSVLAGAAISFAQNAHEIEILLKNQSGFEVPSLQRAEPTKGPDQALPVTLKTLELEQAIELGLTNNSEVKAALAQLGIAQANLKQAGLVENPELFLFLGVESVPAHFLPAGSISQNFLDFFLVGLRKRVAESELKETQLLAADRVLDFIFRVKEAYFTLQGAEHFRQLLREIAEASRVSANLAQKLYEAGNVNLLELNAQKLVAENAQIELARVETEIGTARETLLGLIGLKIGEIEFKKTPRLPPLSGHEPDLKDLETLALERRLDLQATKQKIASLEKNLKLAERQFLSHLNFGISVEREDNGQPVIGPEFSLPLPVSDRNQAQKAKLQAQIIQSRYEVSAVERRILTEVRSTHVKLIESRKIARHYQNQIIPLLKKTIAETELHYNFMLKSPFDLLQAKREEISANRSYVEALRDYWIEQAHLERAVGANYQGLKGSSTKK